MNADQPIAIVGMGCLFPKSSTLEDYWSNILAARDCTSDVPPDHSWRTEDYFDANPDAKDKSWCTRGGFLDKVAFDPLEHGVPPTMLESIDSAQLLSLLVARSALRDAGLDPDGAGWDRERTSCILGITGTQEMAISAGSRLQGPIWRKALKRAGIDDAVAEVIARDIGNHFPTWTEQTFPGLLGNVVAGRIANRLDLGGTNAVVDAACASSLAALQYAASDLLAGRSDLALTGGADTLNDAFMFQCFTRTPAFSKKNDARPFDAAADGILIGEGIAILALERLDDARRNGRRIYATVRGLGSSSDGRFKSIYAPNPVGQAKALRRAYAAAGFGPECVELVEAHGTGTKAGDAAEIEALKTVYREARPTGRWAAIGSVKAQIGHTKSTAGAAGLVKVALALYHKVLPPARIEQPNPKMAFETSPFYLSPRARPWVRTTDHPRRAAVSAFGFGGSNFHAVLEEEAVEPREQAAASHHLFLFGGTPTEVDSGLAGLEHSEADLGQLSAENLALWRPGGQRIVALVTSGREELTRQIAALRSGAKLPEGVFAGSGLESPRVAFLFPGQGSQYIEMGRDLAVRYPVVRAALDSADEAARVLGEPSLSSFVFPPPSWTEAEGRAAEAALTATDVAQPAIGAVTKGMLDLLAALGVTAHELAGHSYGELVALHAAGVYDEAALWGISRSRGRHMAALAGDRGTMAAVSGPLLKIAEILGSHPDVVLANRNHPEQGVVSGSREGVARACEALHAAGLTTRGIPVAAAFHSPLVADASAPLRADLDRWAFRAPAVRVWSDATAEPYPSEPNAIRNQLATQLASPVNFSGIVQRLVAEGVRVFVEVGPRGVLAGLVRKCAPELGTQMTAVAVDRQGDRMDGDRQFKLAIGAIAAAGVPLDPRPLAPVQQKPTARTPGPAAVWLAGANHRNPSTLEPPMPDYPRPKTPPPLADGWGGIPSTGAPLVAPPSLSKSPPEPRPTSPPAPELAGLLESTRQALAAFQATQERTAEVHSRFLDAFSKSNETFAALFSAHARLIEAASGAPVAPRAAPPPTPAYVETTPDAGRVRISSATTSVSHVLPPIFDARAAVEGRTPGASIAVERAPTGGDPEAAMLDAVAAKTGYPRALLELQMDLEADLGIDSIKRVEILAAVKEVIPGLPDLDNDRLSSLRTLAEVIAALRGSAPAPTNHSVVDATLDAVAAKTGYPRNLLELSMDLEADLGIDSIKRVEILAAVKERLPALPDLDQDRLSSLRRLSDVVEALGGSQPLVISPSALGSAVPNDRIVEAMLASVAEKTGYPRNLLELSMDLESDLGVDSIKRVEILAAVHARLPGLPEVDNGALGGLRTLADVVALLGRQPVHLLEFTGFSPAQRALGDAAGWLGVQNDDASGFTGAPALLRPPPAPPVVAVRPSIPPVTTAKELLAAVAPIVALQRHVVRWVPAPDRAPLSHGAIRVTPAPWAAELVAALLARGSAAQLGSPDDATETLVVPSEDARSCFQSARSNAGRATRWISIAIGSGPVAAAIAGVSKTVGAETGRPALALSTEVLDVERLADEILGDRGCQELHLRAESVLAPYEIAVPGAFVGSAPVAPSELMVVSGGARGVTAAVVRELAARWRPALLLLGRAELATEDPTWAAGASDDELKGRWAADAAARGERPTPKSAELAAAATRSAREIRATLADVQASGSPVRYVSLDIRNADAVATAVAAAVAEFGPVRGLLHGAGVLADKRLNEKTDAQWDLVWSTKVDGLAALLAAVQCADLKLAAVFSSVAGRRGNRGQVDYAAANEAIGRTLLGAVPPGIPAKVLDWGPWDGGMVGPALARQFAADGLGLVPMDAGAGACLDELCRPGHEEVVLEGPRPREGFTRLSVRGAPRWLVDHTIGDTPVVPIARVVAWFCDLAREVRPGLHVLEVRDLAVLKGIPVPTPLELALTWTPGSTSDAVNLSLATSAGVVCYRAELLLGTRGVPGRFDGSNGLGANPWPHVGDVYQTHLFHGPAWRVIRTIEGTSAHGLVAVLDASQAGEPQLPGDSEGAQLLDGVLQLPLVWVRETTGAAALPTAIGRLRFHRAWTGALTCHLQVERVTAASGRFSATLVDADNNVVGELNDGQWVASTSLNAQFQQAHRAT